MFVLSFKNGDNDPTRGSFKKYCMALEINDFNALIDNKPFSEQPVKCKQEQYGNLIKMTKNDDCTTGNWLDFLYHQNCNELVCIDLSRQKIRIFFNKSILCED